MMGSGISSFLEDNLSITITLTFLYKVPSGVTTKVPFLASFRELLVVSGDDLKLRYMCGCTGTVLESHQAARKE